MVKKVKSKIDNNLNGLAQFSIRLTNLVGTPLSIVAHTIFFIGIFGLRLFGLGLDSILLILTTAVSLEAIYLAIFIQMTVNRQAQSLASVADDIEEVQDDLGELQEDVEELQDDDESGDKQTRVTLDNIEGDLQKLLRDLEELKRQRPSVRPTQRRILV